IVALLLSAACGVKPSAIRDREASEAHSQRQEIANSNRDTDEIGTDAPADQAAPITGTTAAAASPDVSSLPAGEGTVAQLGPPAPTPAAGPVNGSRSGRSRRAPSGGEAQPSEEQIPGDQPAPARSQAAAAPRQTGPSGPAPAPAPPREVIEGPADRTGVDDTTIRIGIHAPVTGAAPFPQSAFEQSNNLYWKF